MNEGDKALARKHPTRKVELMLVLGLILLVLACVQFSLVLFQLFAGPFQTSSVIFLISALAMAVAAGDIMNRNLKIKNRLKGKMGRRSDDER